MKDLETESEKAIVRLREENEILSTRIDELNSKCELLAKENEILKIHCRNFNANTIINFASYILYYSQNPDSKMDIPNCVYEAVEDKYAKWVRVEYPDKEKTCNNCIHMLETLQARKEGKIGSAFCLDCTPNKYDNWEEIK